MRCKSLPAWFLLLKKDETTHLNHPPPCNQSRSPSRRPPASIDRKLLRVDVLRNEKRARTRHSVERKEGGGGLSSPDLQKEKCIYGTEPRDMLAHVLFHKNKRTRRCDGTSL